MATSVRIPITNIYMGGDYTGQIFLGAAETPLNVILDTGSSALAIDAAKYQPVKGDTTTDVAQTDSYGDGSTWTGAVIHTQIAVGPRGNGAVLSNGNAAIAYQASDNMFRDADGILGLAYAPLDDAFTMPANTWTNRYTSTQVRAGTGTTLTPYLTQLSQAQVTSDRIAFVTHRSFTSVKTKDPASDLLNLGTLVVGGQDADVADLYTGSLQSVKVVSDDWYSTQLKSVIVGGADPIAARVNGPQGMPSNSIIDSGTNSLALSSQLLNAILSKFSTAQQGLLYKSIYGGQLVANSDLDLSSWPTITFVLTGDKDKEDVRLDVPASNYWQLDTQNPGAAAAAITEGQPGLAILGLPLMNGYFTIFDGEADSGRGAVKFGQLR